MDTAVATYEEARMNLDLHLLADVKVVGMTTSGAARLRKLLKALAPPIGEYRPINILYLERVIKCSYSDF